MSWLAPFNRFKNVAGERVARSEACAQVWTSRLALAFFKIQQLAENMVGRRDPRTRSTPARGQPKSTMRDDYIQNALKVIEDPNILVNVVSLRVKQLKRGNRPLIESLEKLSAEDTALREIAEGKISYELATAAELARSHR